MIVIHISVEGERLSVNHRECEYKLAFALCKKLEAEFEITQALRQNEFEFEVNVRS